MKLTLTKIIAAAFLMTQITGCYDSEKDIKRLKSDVWSIKDNLYSMSSKIDSTYYSRDRDMCMLKKCCKEAKSSKKEIVKAFIQTNKIKLTTEQWEQLNALSTPEPKVLYAVPTTEFPNRPAVQLPGQGR